MECVHAPEMAVRVQASWALGNLTDTLSQCQVAKEVVGALGDQLCATVLLTVKDTEKVKVNGVRAAGNLMKALPEIGGHMEYNSKYVGRCRLLPFMPCSMTHCVLESLLYDHANTT